MNNHREEYGDVTLSYAVGRNAWCAPEVDGLPLREYERVEIAVLRGGSLQRPEDVGLVEMQALWERGSRPVARCVAWADVDRVRARLAERAGCELQGPSKGKHNSNPLVELTRPLRVLEMLAGAADEPEASA